MTKEQALILEMNGIRFGFRDGLPVSSESVIRVFDQMEDWLRKERTPVDLNKPYITGETCPTREKLKDEREMPVHSVCYLCRKPIRFVMLTEEERKKYSPQKGFQLMNVKVAIETGAEYFLPLLLIQKIAKVAVCFGAKNKRIFHGELALVNDDCFRLFAKIKIQITLFSQLCIFIKYLTGGMIAKCQKKMKNSTN